MARTPFSFDKITQPNKAIFDYYANLLARTRFKRIIMRLREQIKKPTLRDRML